MAEFRLKNIHMNFKNILNWLFLIFWMGIIFYFSSQPDLKSGLESQMDFVLRKLAHITEYAILTFLAWRAISNGGEKKNLKYLIMAIGFSVFYAIGDEYHQLYVNGRVGSAADVLIDGAGIAITALAVWKEMSK